MKASDVGQGKWPVIMVMGEAWGGSSQDTDVEGSPTSLRDSEVRGGGIIRPTWVSVPHLWLVLGEKVIVLSEGLQIYLFYHPFGWWVPYTCDAKIRFLICTIVTCMAHFSSLCFFWVLF